MLMVGVGFFNKELMFTIRTVVVLQVLLFQVMLHA